MSPVWGEKRKVIPPPDSQSTDDAVKQQESIGEKIKDVFEAATELLGNAIGEAKFGGE